MRENDASEETSASQTRAEKEDVGAFCEDEQYFEAVAQSVFNTVAGGHSSYHAAGNPQAVVSSVQEIYEASGIKDPIGRLQRVELAMKRQQEIQLEKKLRKKEKEREREAAKYRTDSSDKDVPTGDATRRAGGEAGDPATTAASDALAIAREPELKWIEVQAFENQHEALRFIVECQPFTCRPEPFDEPFPRFENTRDALAHVLKMEPLPKEFISTQADFKRRLRIVHVRSNSPHDKDKEKDSTKKLIGKVKAVKRSRHVVITKPWVVEAATVGPALFARPPIRELQEKRSKFYVAVAEDVVDDVLREGFKSKCRKSIPCAASPQEALAAFALVERRLADEKNEQRKVGSDGAATASVAPSAKAETSKHYGRGPVVLAINLPPDIDVVANCVGAPQFFVRRKAKDGSGGAAAGSVAPLAGSGGFRILSAYLPPHCFVRRKTKDEEEEKKKRKKRVGDREEE